MAVFLALALLIPTIDSFICIADAGPQTHAASDQQASNVPAPSRHDDGDNLCIHGHCHHYVGYARLTERIAFVVSAAVSERVRDPYALRSSAPPTELLRPPQA